MSAPQRSGDTGVRRCIRCGWRGTLAIATASGAATAAGVPLPRLRPRPVCLHGGGRRRFHDRGRRRHRRGRSRFALAAGAADVSDGGCGGGAADSTVAWFVVLRARAPGSATAGARSRNRMSSSARRDVSIAANCPRAAGSVIMRCIIGRPISGIAPTRVRVLRIDQPRSCHREHEHGEHRAADHHGEIWQHCARYRFEATVGD